MFYERVESYLSSFFARDWEQRKLGEIAEIIMGQSPDGSTYGDKPNGYILVQGNADLEAGWVKPRTWTTQITKLAEIGDIIMSVRAPAGAVGKTNYRAVIGRGVAAIKGNEFIYQVLEKMDIDSHWKKFSTGSTFESLNSNEIINALIYEPSKKEQNQIGNLFQKLDNLIALHQRKCIILIKINDVYVWKFLGEKINKKFKVCFFKNTSTWEQRKLGELGKARSGVGFPDTEQGGKAGIPFFKVSDMNAEGNENEMVLANNYVTNMQIASRRWSPIEDLPAIFFAKVGAAVMLNRKRLCRFPFLFDNNTMAYSLSKNWWTADFAKALFETVDLTSLVQVGALPSYNAEDVERMEICLPKLSEQIKVGAYFKNLDNLIALHQRKPFFIKKETNYEIVNRK
ncbi:MAG: restriction endonuclease subunit S [Peptostreptococcaceae bacterium]|nr:restriction endonuclease subunit S [Peptostreptococcaceae bacterium]